MFGNKESKEEKAARKEKEILEKYNLQSLNDPKDVESVQKIVNELVGMGILETGLKIQNLVGGGSEKDFLQVQMQYQRAILEQNFIMIRQLDKIAAALESK